MLDQNLIKKTKEVIVNLGFTPDEIHYGQHFLVDQNSVYKFIKACNLKPNDRVLEIGPGLTTITLELVKSSAQVTSIEIDLRFQSLLDELALKYANFSYQIENILDLKLKTLNFDLICGALSYSIFEPLLFRLIELSFNRVVFLVSRKFLEKEGMIKIILNAFYNIEKIDEVDRKNFYPEPKYSGAIIRLTKNENNDFYHFIWREIILQRDKKIKNSLREALILFNKRQNKTLTKKQATDIFKDKINNITLEKELSQLNSEEINSLNIYLKNLNS